MITSKTHEIVTFYAFYEPNIILKNLDKASQILDSFILQESEEIHPIKYIKPIDKDWRLVLNYGWALVHGVVPFSDLVRKSALPTIVKSNFRNYLYDQDVYLCDKSDHDVLFSREEYPLCPNCGAKHEMNTLPKFHFLWRDFHKFYGFREFADMGVVGIMKDCHGYEYPLRRLDIE